MAIAAAESFDPQLLRHGVSVEILLFRAGPIHDFDGVDILQDFQSFGARHRIVHINRRSFMNELKAWIKFVAEGVIGDEKAADIIDDAT